MSDDQSIGALRGRRVAPRAAVAAQVPTRAADAMGGEYVNPLACLVIGSDPTRDWSPLADQDPLEALDAAWEDSEGRLPHEPGYDGKWPTPAPRVMEALADAQDAVKALDAEEAEAAIAQLGKRPALTVIEVQALYVEHAGGASILSLGRRLAEQGRYSSATSAGMSLRHHWRRLGLPFGTELDALRTAA